MIMMEVAIITLRNAMGHLYTAIGRRDGCSTLFHRHVSVLFASFPSRPARAQANPYCALATAKPPRAYWSFDTNPTGITHCRASILLVSHFRAKACLAKHRGTIIMALFSQGINFATKICKAPHQSRFSPLLSPRKIT
jgi:hypothetical protein